MKKRNIIWVLPALLALTTLGSCSIVQNATGGKKVKQEATLPQDREAIVAKTNPQVYTSEELKRGVVKGDWAIETVNGKEAVGEKSPFLKFVPSEGRVYGSNGCNVINATYSYNPADSVLRFSNIASTMMACEKEGLTDYEINVALDATRTYTWSLADSNYLLYLYDETGKEVMTLMHQNFQFLNGTWRVARIGSEKIDNPDMKMVIDVDEGRLHGNTGCNIFNGTMEIDMEGANSIGFSGIALTRMACPDMKGETAFIVALEEVAAARPVSASEVILYDTNHEEVMRLVRTTATAD